MKTHHLTRLACLTTLAAAMAGSAHAQEANYYYFGLSAGQSHSQLSETDTTNSLLGTGNGASVLGNEQQDTAYKIFGGYQFNRNFAIEGGYFNLGKFSYRAASPTGTLNGTYEVDGLNLDLIGTLPLSERFSAFGRIGAQYANTRDSFSGTGSLTPADRNPSKRDTNLKVGVGLQYDISPSMQLRGEAERYRINDAFDNRGDVNVFSLSLVFPIGRKAATPVAVATPAVYVAPVVQPMPEPMPVAKAAPAPVVVPMAPPPPTRVQLSADSMFGFDKAVIGPNGKTTLDTFAKDTAGVKFDAISVEGNADRLGSAAYNDKLSLQRAEAVKAYLATTPQLQGATINASGKGESNPMTKPGECVGTKPTKALLTCLQPDRRVDVEMTGVR
ncbi:MAG: outer membrane beta-barrel protein [Rhodoferax sp.]|nr:outer membrane beta-barrel protein [Rhodoferax sp.]